MKWIAKDAPRQRFARDLLYSFGAFMTLCEICRNDAEKRIREMSANDRESAPTAAIAATTVDSPGGKLTEAAFVD